MSKSPTWTRLLLLAEWPAGDRAAWAASIEAGDILDGGGPAARWAAATRKTNCEHYGRWLGFLRREGSLDAISPPQQRATVEAVRRFIEHLRAEVAPRTVVSRIVGLKVMLKALFPDADWRWLADACNALNRAAKPQRSKASRMRPTGEIYVTATAELDRLLATSLKRRIERIAFRDALMLAMMSARPLRLKNFAAIEIGRHLLREGPAWILSIPGREVKNGQPLEFILPESLGPYLEVYLQRVRPSFLGTQPTQALWTTFEGRAIADQTVSLRFVATTTRLFGVSINPHLLRDCAATSLSTVSPAAARSAAALLGHRHYSTTERYYIRANQLEASRTLNAALAAIKTSLE